MTETTNLSDPRPSANLGAVITAGQLEPLPERERLFLHCYSPDASGIAPKISVARGCQAEQIIGDKLFFPLEEFAFSNPHLLLLISMSQDKIKASSSTFPNSRILPALQEKSLFAIIPICFQIDC